MPFDPIVVLSPFFKGLLGAIVGGLIIYVALTLYQDHLALQQLVTFINAYGVKIQKLP